MHRNRHSTNHPPTVLAIATVSQVKKEPWLSPKRLIIPCIVGMVLNTCLLNTTRAAEPTQTTFVGRSVRFEQVVIDGPELKAKPITQETPLVLRIERVYPHGSAFRYDIEAYALEVGDYDLHDYLEPVDGSEAATSSATSDLTLRAESTLGDGQPKPNALKSQRSPWLGGYRLLTALAIALWCIGLVALLGWGRKKRAAENATTTADAITTAERLRPLINDAIDGTLGDDQRAILERLLLTHWRERLKLTETDPAKGLAILREHPEAGELLRNLEDWLHRPDPPSQVNVEQLLRPYLESRSTDPLAESKVLAEEVTR